MLSLSAGFRRVRAERFNHLLMSPPSWCSDLSSIAATAMGGNASAAQVRADWGKSRVNVARFDPGVSSGWALGRTTISRCFMRPHLSVLIVVIALGASSAVLAAGTSTSSAGGGASSGGGGGAHGGGGGSHGGGGGGGHGGGVGGHGALGGGFSNSGRFGSANLGRGAFTQAVGNHAFGHAIATKTAARENTHPGNPEHHHHHRFWRSANTDQFAVRFRSCAGFLNDPDEDFIFGPHLLCGSAVKAPTNPRSGRPAG